MTTIGVDPGPRNVGCVIKDATRLLEAFAWVREDDETVEAFAADVADMIVDRCNWHADRTGRVLVGVEGLNPPNPHLGMVSVQHHSGTNLVRGVILGAVRFGAVRADTVTVPPARHGRGPLAAYPARLVGPRETTGAGKSKWQHLRAAWDIAHAAETIHRTETR